MTMIITNNNSKETEATKIYSVSEAKQVNSGRITVTGMIISRSVTFKTISKSEWECKNLSCVHHGYMTFNPPRVLPVEKLDNTNGHQLRCTNCQSDALDVKHEYHDAVAIQIVDIDKTDNYNSLDVILYDKTSRNIVAGEVVNITGDIHIQRKGENGKGKKLVNVLHSDSIFYKNKEDTKLTSRDIEIIYKHKKIVENSMTYVDTAFLSSIFFV